MSTRSPSWPVADSCLTIYRDPRSVSTDGALFPTAIFGWLMPE